MDMMKNRPSGCGSGTGALPACGRLAAAYVPLQPRDAERYRPEDALLKGTLFPGLDLPWMNVSNASPAEFSGTPLGELMALGFVVHELGLYLDTHSDDAEALQLFSEYVQLLQQGRETFVTRYGPLQQTQAAGGAGYAWLKDPWPWEYRPFGGACDRRDD